MQSVFYLCSNTPMPDIHVLLGILIRNLCWSYSFPASLTPPHCTSTEHILPFSIANYLYFIWNRVWIRALLAWSLGSGGNGHWVKVQKVLVRHFQHIWDQWELHPFLQAVKSALCSLLYCKAGEWVSECDVPWNPDSLLMVMSLQTFAKVCSILYQCFSWWLLHNPG